MRRKVDVQGNIGLKEISLPRTKALVDEKTTRRLVSRPLDEGCPYGGCFNLPGNFKHSPQACVLDASPQGAAAQQEGLDFQKVGLLWLP